MNASSIDDDWPELRKAKTVDDHPSSERLARIETHLEHVLERLEEVVSRAEFLPVKLISYGLAGGVLTAFLGAVIFNVMTK